MLLARYSGTGIDRTQNQVRSLYMYIMYIILIIINYIKCMCVGD